MTTSILNDTLLLKNQTPDKLQEYLQSINLTIFDPIFHNSQNLEEAKQKVLYILTAFSEDSPLLILRQDSKEEKEGICEYLGIPEYMRGALQQLSDQDARRAVTEYLTKYAGVLFKTLMFLRIQYDDIQLGITSRAYTIKTRTTDKEGVVTETEMFDFKESGKAVMELLRLAKMIDTTEKQIRSQVKKMEEIEDLKIFSQNAKDSGKIKGGRNGKVENVIA